ncbi:MAG: O-antigen ligase family protein [Elusimicrobia bacterium]|nr:O-antigen ligase family protein [Elusimicrobiota bacterium]
MLAILLCLLVAAGPLLRGSWDLWAQTLLLTVLAAGSSLWLAGRVLVGHVPLPSGRVALWACLLAALGGWSAYASPVAVYAVPEWRWRLAGLWVFVALTLVQDDDRAVIDGAIRAAAWVLLLLVLHQRLFGGEGRPPGSLLKENVFAGACLLFLPVAFQKRDYALTAGLLLAMLWTRSVGAWLALGLGLALFRPGRAARWLGAAVAAVCLAAALFKLRDPAVMDRLRWWSAAGRMFLDRPWTGFGPGAFAYVAPAFSTGDGVKTLYAHQVVLETLAECGWLYGAAWFAGIAALLRGRDRPKAFGALTVLIQSMWDITLSIPACFWMFCYFAGSAVRESGGGVNVLARHRLPAAFLALALGWGVSTTVWSVWEADRVRAMAAEALSSGAGPAGAGALLSRSIALSDHPESRRMAAEVALRLSPEGSREGLLAAAAELERAARLDPYRRSTWTSLELMYRGLGMGGEAARASREGGRFRP